MEMVNAVTFVCLEMEVVEHVYVQLACLYSQMESVVEIVSNYTYQHFFEN